LITVLLLSLKMSYFSLKQPFFLQHIKRNCNPALSPKPD
jgi:hypothetical protein